MAQRLNRPGACALRWAVNRCQGPHELDQAAALAATHEGRRAATGTLATAHAPEPPPTLSPPTAGSPSLSTSSGGVRTSRTNASRVPSASLSSSSAPCPESSSAASSAAVVCCILGWGTLLLPHGFSLDAPCRPGTLRAVCIISVRQWMARERMRSDDSRVAAAATASRSPGVQRRRRAGACSALVPTRSRSLSSPGDASSSSDLAASPPPPGLSRFPLLGGLASEEEEGRCPMRPPPRRAAPRAAPTLPYDARALAPGEPA